VEFTILGDRNEIDVPGGPFDQPKGSQGGTPDYHYFLPVS
jgi:hypothetical protein